MSADASELRAFAADCRSANERLNRHLYPAVEVGGRKIKDAMVADAAGSKHFKALAPTITYDVHQTSFGGVGVLEVEVGPDKERGAGPIGNVAYFGTSRGGGTVRDPQEALDDEVPHFEAAVADILGDIL